MIYDNIDFHNVAELTEVEGEEGFRVQRVPEDTRKHLSENGQGMMLSPVANVELRFLLESDSAEITLSAGDDRGLKCFVYWSGMREREFYEIGAEPTTIKLEMQDRYKRMDPEHAKASGYTKNLVRLMFAGFPDVQLFYHGIIKGEISAPSESDTPAKTLLTYGTSITHGARVSGSHLTYAYQTAHNLGMDLINLGSAGTAFCERAMTDHIASRGDWDIATLALSVNMYNNTMFSFETFKERASYMVNTVAKANPDKPVFCITLYPFFDDIDVYNEESTKSADDYRQALRDIVSESDCDNVHLVEGKEILTDFTLLAPDLIHPNDMGMVQMGRNLAEKVSLVLQMT